MAKKTLEKKIEDTAKKLDKLICQWYAENNPESKERYWSGTGRNYTDFSAISITVRRNGDEPDYIEPVSLSRTW